MSPWQVLLETLGDELRDRLDGDLLPSLYAAVSVPTEVIRATFRAEGIAFIDANAGQWPDALSLEESAKQVIAQARRRGVSLSVVSGLVGAVAIPPEVLASLVLALRLGQRMAVVFGFDPETNAGRLVLWRAVAAAYDLEMPSQAQVGMRVSDLPELLKSQLPSTRGVATWMGKRVARRMAMPAVKRATRLVPGRGAGGAGFTAHRRVDAMGARMLNVFRRSVEAQPFDVLDESLAVEVEPSPTAR